MIILVIVFSIYPDVNIFTNMEVSPATSLCSPLHSYLSLTSVLALQTIRDEPYTSPLIPVYFYQDP